MGRPSTGAWTVYESSRIEMSYLLKHIYLKKGRIASGNLEWSNQHGKKLGSIGLICCYGSEDNEKFIVLEYTITDRSGKKTALNYRVWLIEVDSNLGKGKVLYFKCPQSGKRSRILYKAYDSDIFKSREAYKNILYYDCQQSSKLSRYNENYWRIDKHLSDIKTQASNGDRTYKGLLTKRAVRFNWLSLKQMKMDHLRWTEGVPKRLRQFDF